MATSNITHETDSANNQQRVVRRHRRFLNWFDGISLTLSHNSLITSLFLILFAILIFLYFPTWEGDTDMWFHFALGKYYITHQTMEVNHAIFSWTPATPDWFYNTWLGSTLEYLIYVTAGGFGLWLFQWTIFGGIFLFLLYFVRSIQGRLDVNAISLIFMTAIPGGVVLLTPKPELFSPLFFTAMLYIYFSIKLNKMSRYHFYLYPLLFIFWVNLHGGFIVGLATIVILLITEGLTGVIARRNALSTPTLIHFACSVVLICLACLVNPYGLAYLWDTIVVNYPLFKEITGERSLFMSSIAVHSRVWPHLFHLDAGNLKAWATGWIMVVMLALFFIITFVAYKKKKGADLSLLLLNPLFFYYGMNMGRACIFFPIISFFSLYYTFEKAEVLLKLKRFTIIAMIFFIFLGFIALIPLTTVNVFNSFGMNLEKLVPVEEVAMIKTLKLPPPLFNDYLSGSYMIWAMYPEYKVFIDSRGGPYDKTGVGADLWEMMTSPKKETIQRFLNKYPFRVALINYYYLNTIFKILDNRRGDWIILFLGRKAVIMIHKSLRPILGQELLSSIDNNPIKFRDVLNPNTLFNVFLIYVNASARSGEVIRDIYKKKISNFYLYKKDRLREMEMIISQKRADQKKIKAPE